MTKMRSSQTIGELQPWPGTSTFQTTFSLRLQVSGSAASSAITPGVQPPELRPVLSGGRCLRGRRDGQQGEQGAGDHGPAQLPVVGGTGNAWTPPGNWNDGLMP